MHRTPLPAALLTVLALLLAACGGSSEDDARALLRDTFGASEPVRSGKLSVKLDVDARGVPSVANGLSLSLSGPFQSRGAGRVPSFDLDLGLRAGGTDLRAGAVSTGEQGWLKLQDQAYTLTDELFGQLRRGQRQDGGGQADGVDLKALGVDPEAWLRDPERVGEEQLGGTPTVHVRGGVDVARMLGDLAKLLERAGSLGSVAGAGQVPTQLTPQQRERVTKSVQEATVDVWSGAADRQLRRVLIAVRFDVPEDVRGAGKPEQQGTVRFDLRIDELNRRQAIRPPADARPLRELQQGLQALGRATQGARQQRPAQPEQPQAPGGAAGSAYARCLAEAGGDLAAQQDCASLLGR